LGPVALPREPWFRSSPLSAALWLVEGDPLGLRPRAERAAQRCAWLRPAERLLPAVAAALVADWWPDAGAHQAGPPALAPRDLDRAVRRAVVRWLRAEEGEGARAGLLRRRSRRRLDAWLAGGVGLDQLARRERRSLRELGAELRRDLALWSPPPEPRTDGAEPALPARLATELTALWPEAEHGELRRALLQRAARLSPAAAPSVAVAALVEEELAREVQRRGVAALDALLAQWSAAALAEESPAATTDDPWRLLARLPGSWPAPPAPGEELLEVLRRLVAARVAAAPGSLASALHEVRLRRCEGGVAAALAHLRLRSPGDHSRARRAWLAERVRLELARGRVAAARQALRGSPRALAEDRELAALDRWCTWLLEVGPLQGPPPPLPTGIAPAGRARRAVRGPCARPGGELRLRELGAHLLVWVRLRADGGWECSGGIGLSELDPLERDRLERSLRRRGGSQSPERVALCGTVVEAHAGPQGLAGALCRRTRAWVLVPSGGGTAAGRGYLRAEFEHHLVPSHELLRRAADAGPAGFEQASSDELREGPAPARAPSRSPSPRECAAREWLRAWTRRTGLRGAILVDGRGQRLAGPPLAALARDDGDSVSSADLRRFELESPRQREGAVLWRGPPGPLPDPEFRRHAAAALQGARLRERWLDGEWPPPIPIAAPGGWPDADWYERVAAGRGPLCLRGDWPAALAAVARAITALRGESPRGEATGGPVEPEFAGPRSVVFGQGAEPRERERLLRAAAAAGRPWLWLELRDSPPPPPGVASANLPRRTALRGLLFEGLPTWFADRALARGERAVELCDSARAALWRLPDAGLYPTLERLEPLAGRLDAAAVERAASLAGVRVPLRCPSRQPDRLWLLATLQLTRTAGGRWNKRRAARYLGWDADTLRRRLRETGVRE
jgi:hypothetical protein